MNFKIWWNRICSKIGTMIWFTRVFPPLVTVYNTNRFHYSATCSINSTGENYFWLWEVQGYFLRPPQWLTIKSACMCTPHLKPPNYCHKKLQKWLSLKVTKFDSNSLARFWPQDSYYYKTYRVSFQGIEELMHGSGYDSRKRVIFPGHGRIIWSLSLHRKCFACPCLSIPIGGKMGSRIR